MNQFKQMVNIQKVVEWGNQDWGVVQPQFMRLFQKHGTDLVLAAFNVLDGQMLDEVAYMALQHLIDVAKENGMEKAVYDVPGCKVLAAHAVLLAAKTIAKIESN